MLYKQITRVEREDAGHGHIVRVAAPGQFGREQWFTVSVVYALMKFYEFHTGSVETRDYARVDKFRCPSCGRGTLRSKADGIWSNNLDNLAA